MIVFFQKSTFPKAIIMHSRDFSLDEMLKIIKSLDVYKVHGLDDISINHKNDEDM